jgi:hypothetical protein
MRWRTKEPGLANWLDTPHRNRRSAQAEKLRKRRRLGPHPLRSLFPRAPLPLPQARQLPGASTLSISLLMVDLMKRLWLAISFKPLEIEA